MAIGSEYAKRLSDLEARLVLVEHEPDPHFTLTDEQADEVRRMLIDMIRTTENPKKTRMFFKQVIERIVIGDTDVAIYYNPNVLFSSGERFMEGASRADARFAVGSSRLPEGIDQDADSKGKEASVAPRDGLEPPT